MIEEEGGKWKGRERKKGGRITVRKEGKRWEGNAGRVMKGREKGKGRRWRVESLGEGKGTMEEEVGNGREGKEREEITLAGNRREEKGRGCLGE